MTHLFMGPDQACYTPVHICLSFLVISCVGVNSCKKLTK